MDRFKALETFVSVADQRSFAGAARLCGQSAARVTRTIAALEAHLGVTLFHRAARRVTVTDDGERVYASAQQIFEGVEPGGAVSLAAILAGKVETAGLTTAVVLSGGNVDPALFSAIIEDRFTPIP